MAKPLAGNERGEADGQVQGYNLRLIMTEVESNKIMPEAPQGYNRDDFTAALAHFESKRIQRVFSDGHDGIYRAHLPNLPNGKADINDTPKAPIRLSMPDINDAYPQGDATTRAEIVRQHYYYNIGLLYFLQNDPAVPEAIRTDARRFGWCKDEFQETRGIPPQLYIREARRLIGQHVFTGRDTAQLDGDARAILHTDSIATGDYIHNCHGTGRVGSRFEGQHVGEFYKVIQPFQVPYGVIVPQKCENLLVPVACSASHFGFGALRLEPMWCSLGQAAGWAATLSIQTSTPVQNIDVQGCNENSMETEAQPFTLPTSPLHPLTSRSYKRLVPSADCMAWIKVGIHYQVLSADSIVPPSWAIQLIYSDPWMSSWPPSRSC